MNDLRELYQEVILDHSRQPRNFREESAASRKAEGYNPLCGDRVTVFLKLDGDVVKEATFQGSGCAISTASASLMTEALKGKTLDEARAIFHKFHDLITGGQSDSDLGPALGKLEAFSGVNQYPARAKCATLAWHTVNAALENAKAPVTTE